MLKDVFKKLIGNAIVASGRAIKIYNLEMYSRYGFDITPEQYLVLNMVNEDENLSQNKLCELLYKDKSNMARIISILEEKGLIERTQKTDNKKQVNIIKITQKGRDTRNKIAPVMQSSRENYLKGIDEDDMYACIKVLNQIRENLESAEDDNKKTKGHI